MAEKVLIYAGTTEGRLLAQELSRAHIACDVHVATEYGQMVMPELAGVKVCVGRLDVEEMRALLKKNGQNNYAAVVDATHPFATEVSANIRESTKGSGIPYLRLQRRMDDGICSIPENEGMKERAGTVHVFADYESCVQALTDTSGNILLTTGSKELAVFAPLKERLFVRVLPGLESIGLCEKAGIRGKQILAMQGPFSEEMNLAMIHQFSIRYLVTKASGAHSGFQEKLAAAQKAGITACVIGKQEQEQGMSYAQVTETLSRLLGHTISGRPEVEISLIGIGMSAATLTQEAKRALEESDVVFGAERMLEMVENSKETYPFYLAKDILPVLRQKESQMDGQKLKVSILFSGDTGFYSGTEKIKTELNKNNYKKIRIFPGISSVSYLSAATGIAWQDAKIISIHGKKDTAETRALVLDAIRHFPKTFLLVSGVEDVRRIGCWIEEEKLTQTRMIAGFQLSYDREKIRELSYEEAKNAKEEGLYTLLLCNENVQKRRLVPGMSDESFLRVMEGEKTVPMTKEEVRALSLCKLGLTEDAVVYDVGSGTGSIAVECAKCSPGIRVYAIEQKATAQQLLRRNLEKFHLANVIPVDGKAPDILESLEPPTHVFIGGSSGCLADILHVIWEKNPRTRVVVNAISLETVAQITELAAGKMQTEIIQVQVSRAKTVGTYHLMQAENPVYICVLTMA